MRIFLKFMDLPLWCCFATSLITFFCFLASYLCSEMGERIGLATCTLMQGIMFCVTWGLIGWAMHDRDKRQKEHEKYMEDIKQEIDLIKFNRTERSNG